MSKENEEFESTEDRFPELESEEQEEHLTDDEEQTEDEAIPGETSAEDAQKSVSFPNDSKSDEMGPNETIFENLYEPKILAPWREEKRKSSRSRQRELQQHKLTAKDITYVLNDMNAERFGDVSRVGWKGRLEYAMTEFKEEMKRMMATKHEIQYDSNRLLNITIGTVICLARKKTAPKECFMFTEMYLKSIRNEYGDHPENIGNLLKYMRYLKRRNSSNYDWGEMNHFEPPRKLVIAKINADDMQKTINLNMAINKSLNKSRIPVPLRNRSQLRS